GRLVPALSRPRALAQRTAPYPARSGCAGGPAQGHRHTESRGTAIMVAHASPFLRYTAPRGAAGSVCCLEWKMKRFDEFLSILRCPFCAGDFSFEPRQAPPGQGHYGILACGCSKYPVLDDVPV